MKQWILAKFLCDRVYFWAFFYANRVLGVERFATHPCQFPSQVPPGSGGLCGFSYRTIILIFESLKLNEFQTDLQDFGLYIFSKS